MSEKINVLLIEPGKYPKQIEIEDTLEAMQETVGGYIEEYMPFDDEVAIVCNEEGKMNGAELNRAIYSNDKGILDIIAGKFFIAYTPIESESFLSMPKDLMKKYEDKFRYPERLSDEVIMKLNDQLNMIRDNIGTEQEVIITYFVPDDKKAGGAYITHSGMVKKIDEFERNLIMQDEIVIPIEQISEIQGEMFKGLYE